MIDPKTIDDIAARFFRALPDDFTQLSIEFKEVIRKSMSAALAKSDLVSREEFDIQTAVLARSREKLESLESQVAALEEHVNNTGHRPEE